MSDKQKPQESHQAEREEAAKQVGVIDMVSGATGVAQLLPFGWKVPRVFGKTNFEGHALNAMIDMVESAKPEDLELAGTALLNAQTAIEDAAEELEGHITRVDWEGESGEAFRKWGANLVIHARKLAAFADAAGTQITAAATGLASVRSAMPPRDTREDPKAVADIPTPKQIESNAEYAAAVKAEKDRQEAINQMNRLASFYAVSEEIMAGQEPPTFEPMPDVGVPKPDPGYKAPIITGDDVRGNGGLGAARESVAAGQESSSTTSSHSHSGGITPPLKQVDDSPITSVGNVGTKIDSVGTLSPQEAARPTTSVGPTMTGPTSGSGGTAPPFPTGTIAPALSGPAGRTSAFGGANGGRAPITAQGRTGTPSGAVGGRGVTGPMGQATTTGQSGARGGSASPMGRGVSGGMPRAVGGPASDRAGGSSATGAARGNGVVGGRPATGAQGATGSKVPRGTVVGAGNSGSRAPAGQIGQRGVIGAPNSTPGARPGRTARPAAGNADGVIGTPKGRAPARRSGGPTGGGAGAPHGRTGNSRNTNRGDREGESQPETPRRNTLPVTD
ncbi:hypothetical protein [Streptomyces tuirus]